MTAAERKQALADFTKPEILLLITTDAASEGLNLQEHCHRVIHYELPFNPNRLLQRQGRVDRYGQTHACEFAYLYAEDTYEGQVLARLFVKLERQIKSLGSVGDALGSLQTERIEELLARSPSDVKAAIEEADRAIDAELNRVTREQTQARLGDDDPTPSELQRLSKAIDIGNQFNVTLIDFLIRAISLAGGECEKRDGKLIVSAVPAAWLGGRMPERFDALYASHDSAPKGTSVQDILDHEHRLVQAATRWVRQTRYKHDDDHRLAARLVEGLDQPDLIATFLATIRAGDNTEIEQLISVRVQPDQSLADEDAAALLAKQGVGNVPPDCIARLFGSWWSAAADNAQQAATKRAERWRAAMHQERVTEAPDLRRQFDVWSKATRDAITAGYDMQQRLLPGMDSPLPPAVQRRLKEHRKEVDDYLLFLEKRLLFDPPQIEPLGVLLRVPAKEVQS